MSFYDKNHIEILSTFDSRNIIGYALKEICKQNDKVVVAYADVGSRFGIPKAVGNRGIQVSIAEQSLIGIISGLCHEGFIPFGVAYAPFITMRAADQIRMSIGEMGLGIKIIGGSAGLVSGNLGSASMALDDIAMMRAIPNLIIESPADAMETMKVIETASMIEKPIYIRMTGGNGLTSVYTTDFDFQIGKANILRQYGRDLVIYAVGVQVASACSVSDKLKENGVKSIVVDMHTIKPLDCTIIEEFSDVPLAVSIEEHNIVGGLGSAIAEAMSFTGKQKLLRIGVQDCYPAPDTYDSLLKTTGLSMEEIYKTIWRTIT